MCNIASFNYNNKAKRKKKDKYLKRYSFSFFGCVLFCEISEQRFRKYSLKPNDENEKDDVFIYKFTILVLIKKYFSKLPNIYKIYFNKTKYNIV